MNDPTNITAATNTTPKSYVDVNCDCNTMWSFAQQFSNKRLCTLSGEHKGKLIRNYSVRARRIAATYARFYLENEDGGNTKYKGRYYWMALGAFASKTVACTFDAWQVRGMTPFDSTVWDGLGKGNFWLFCDISGWHWYHNMHRMTFDQCAPSRDAKKYVGPVKEQIKNLPWQSEALPVIKNFLPSKYVLSGFKKVAEYERAMPRERPRIQLAHLIDIANHEQGVILQPLIYKNQSFSNRIKLQRAWYANWASPTVELIFTHLCSSNEASLKSVAPDETELENLASRMSWILLAAEKFHQLMLNKRSFMEAELKIMADWKDLPDTPTNMEIIKNKSRELGRFAKDLIK